MTYHHKSQALSLTVIITIATMDSQQTDQTIWITHTGGGIAISVAATPRMSGTVAGIARPTGIPIHVLSLIHIEVGTTAEGQGS